MQGFAIIFLTVLAVLLATVQAKNVLKAVSRNEDRPDFVIGNRAKATDVHKVTFAVKPLNMESLKDRLYDISNVDSPNYGRHMNRAEIDALTNNPAGTRAVTEWLTANNVHFKSTKNGLYLEAKAPIGKWEELFSNTFHVYSHTTKSNVRVARAHEYSLPEEVAVHVDGVLDLIHLPAPRWGSPRIVDYDRTESNSRDLWSSLKVRVTDIFRPLKTRAQSGYSYMVTPYTLQTIYGITGTGNGYGSQSFYNALNQTFSASDLATFQNNYGVTADPVDHYVNDIIDPDTCTGAYAVQNCAEASLDVQYMTAVGRGVETTYWYDSSEDASFNEWIQLVSDTANPPLVHSISYASYETFMDPTELTAFNNEAIKLGAQGVTIVAASGDDGVSGFLARTYPNLYCGYFPAWPASSPYVVAVGATMGGMETSGSRSKEVACSVPNSAITTGGGFSFNFAAPNFQKTAINNYFRTAKDAKQAKKRYAKYNKFNRGYPDVAMTGDRYAVVIDGSTYLLSGTSASSPVFAGMVSLVNAYRLQRGFSTLGWLNPAIYKNNGQFTRDITTGNNKCTAESDICCDEGFYAAKGWDPLTGFGSVDYTKFLAYFSTRYPGKK